MKLYLLGLIFSLLIVQQPTQPNIIGNWVYDGEIDKKNQIQCCIECPELLKINSNGSYSVLNDCYADDLRKPVVETGKWEFVEPQKKLILKDRKFLTNPYLFSQMKTIELKVVLVDSKKLKLKYNQDSIVQYKRVK